MSLGVKSDCDLKFLAAEGNSKRKRIRVLGLLVPTAHMQILPSDNDSLSEGKISPS